MTAPLSWVIGSGGLLGSHVTRALGARGPLWQAEAPVSWQSPQAAAQLRSSAAAFLAAAGQGGWQVAWCAGAAVTHTSAADLAHEHALLDGLLDGLTPGADRAGGLFLASSAGGVYAGAEGAPFTELHPTRALAPYGEAKLGLEQAANTWSAISGVPVVVGRIANLYGPGQNLGKPQGLISHICRAHLLRRPISVFVPMGTVRDYLYVEDAGELVADVLERLRWEGTGVHLKVLASQRGLTIGSVVGELRRVLRSPLKVVHGTSAAASLQAADLRLRSVVWPEIDRRPLTPMPVGMSRTVAALTKALQAGQLR